MLLGILNPRIVSRGQQVSTDLLSSGQELIKLQVIVAETARNWCATREILVDKWTHHIALKTVLMFHDVVSNPKMLCNVAPFVNVLDRAASPLHLLRLALASGKPPLVPELHRQA